MNDKEHASFSIETDTANRMSINVYDEAGSGLGYRLAGRKFDGTGSPVVVANLTRRDADEIRQHLDLVFPDGRPSDLEAQAFLAEQFGEHAAELWADRFHEGRQ